MGGEDGMPILATGAKNDHSLYRFDPWRAEFELIRSDAPAVPRADSARAALDAQAFVWVDRTQPSATLWGARFGSRNHFALDGDLLPISTNDRSPPAYALVPDRPTQGKVHYDSVRLIFEPDSTARVFVAGTDYAGVDLKLAVDDGSPIVVLGTDEFGGTRCAWPDAGAREFRLERRDDRVRLSSPNGATIECEGPKGRVRLGLARSETRLVVSGFTLERTPD
jgi:hypothetical protein